MNVIDALDQRILNVLLTDSRTSLKQLTEQVGLSSPNVSECLRRLEERGVIRHYIVGTDPASLGYMLQTIIRAQPTLGELHIVQQLIEEIPEIGECDKVTGEDYFIARLCVHSVSRLDEILDRVAYHAKANTAIAKAQPVKQCASPFAPAD